jgi:hypothetical protein
MTNVSEPWERFFAIIGEGNPWCLAYLTLTHLSPALLCPACCVLPAVCCLLLCAVLEVHQFSILIFSIVRKRMFFTVSRWFQYIS